MLPQPNTSFFPTPDDSELEWLLCLAAAVQAREKQQAELAAKDEPTSEPTFLRSLQALLKGLRKSERIRAA
jgi:hypothetical protein